jgi:hypothetical protein
MVGSLVLAGLCLPILPLRAQSAAEPLYMPRAVKQTFKNGTRSPDGRPGRRYWQNRGRYTETLHQTPSIWKSGRNTVTFPVHTARKSLRSIELDGGIFMDADTTNNGWRGCAVTIRLVRRRILSLLVGRDPCWTSRRMALHRGVAPIGG